MKINKISRVIMGSALAFTLLLSTLVPTVKVEAASNSTSVRRYISDDGINIRREGWDGGTSLGLMYEGEAINFYPDVVEIDVEYNYMYRLKNYTYGYVDHHFVRANQW